MAYYKQAFLLFGLMGILYSCNDTWQSEHVWYGTDGRLHYTPDEQGNIIPDFSHVGYRYGDVRLPDISVVLEIEPVEGDNGKHLQKAIDKVAMMPLQPNGYRGAILLKRGEYPVSESISLHTSGIVLKGEGENRDGSVIIATGDKKRSLLIIGGRGAISEAEETRTRIREAYVPVGRKYLILESTEHVKPGDDILITRPGTQQWINDLKMDSFPPREDGGVVHPWQSDYYHLSFERVISRISGDTIFFRNPMVMVFEEKYGGAMVSRYSYEGRIENAGIENILFVSEYTHEEDEQHGWNAVLFQHVQHAWAQHVTAHHFGYACVNIGQTAKHISISNCTNLSPVSIIMGGRRYSFKCDGQLSLFRNCRSSHARHDYATGAKVSGPNVFSNCTAIHSYNDIGPHHRWAMGTLYDRIITDGPINVQDRGNRGSGHGWSGVTQVFWNCEGKSAISQSPWVTGKNYNIGFKGEKKPGEWSPDRPDGEWEGHNRPGLFPQSLYEAQLAERTKNKNM